MKFKVNDSVGGNFTILDPDVYEATFKKYEEMDLEFGPALKLFFEIKDMVTEEGGPVTIDGIASVPKNGLTLKSKLRGWIEGMLGRNLAGSNEEVDLDALIGTDCRLTVEQVTKGTREDGSPKVFNNITTILPFRRQSGPRVVANSGGNRQPVGAAPANLNF